MQRLAFMVLALVIAPSVAIADQPVTWLGFTFGTPVLSYRSSVGDPLVIFSIPLGAPVERNATFTTADPQVRMYVRERAGVVTSIQASEFPQDGSAHAAIAPDPAGVKLGDAVADVMRLVPTAQPSSLGLQVVDAARGATVDYTISQDHVAGIRWAMTDPPTGPVGPGSYVTPDATSVATAVLDVQPNERLGVRWEALYEISHPCAPGLSRWREVSTSLRKIGDRTYDVNTLQCTPTGDRREFWFDITSFFGKS